MMTYTQRGQVHASCTNRKAELEEKLELSRRPELYENLARSLAPLIWEMEDVKEGILPQFLQIRVLRRVEEGV